MTACKVERLLTMLLAVVVLVVALSMLMGCKTPDPVVKYQPYPVPEPYWDPPKDLRPLPPGVELQVSHMSVEDAEADPTRALRIVGQDLNTCLEDDAHMRHLYSQLLAVCSAPPTATTPTPTPAPD